MKNSSIRASLWLLAGIGMLAVLWQSLSLYFGPLIMPSPLETVHSLAKMAVSGRLWKESAATLWRGLAGFSLSVAVGMPFGLMLGLSQRLEKFFWPVLVGVQTTPLVSWLLLAIIWFGLSGNLPVFIVFITTVPLVVINTYHGVKAVDPDFIEMAEVFKVKRSRIITEIYLPQLAPFLLSGFSAALGTTWKAVAMAELFSARNGIGAGLSIARMNLETSEVLAWTIVLMVLGLITDRMLSYLSRRSLFYRKQHK